MNFNPLTGEAVRKLSALLGPESCILDQDERARYGKDETEDLQFLPDLVVRPTAAAEISSLLKFATEHRIPVTPRGGGTGLSGGALPVHGGILLSMERFNKIIEIDRENLQATVEPGVVTQRLHEEVESLGLYYPPDPASRGSCQIGGNLAECAGGPHAVKYGVTRDYVLGLEAVLPTGEIMRTGARVGKNVAGYDLTQLLIGSEGTLAVLTKAILRLIPLPRFRKLLLIPFPTLEQAASAVSALLGRGIAPSACEFLERAAVEIAEARSGKKWPNSTAPAQLYVEVDGNHEPALQEEAGAVAEIVASHGAGEPLLAEEAAKIREVWDLRRGIGEAVKSISAYKEEDTVVPPSRLPDLVRGVKELCARTGVTSVCYGHAGDGNVHVNLLRKGMDDAAWRRVTEETVPGILTLAVSLGGTISGEHGIGYSQRNYLPIALDEAAIRMMAGIKAAFDPAGILNPGKIFPSV